MDYTLKSEFSIYTLTDEAKAMADTFPDGVDKHEWANAYVTSEIERQAAQLIYTLGDMLNASATAPAVIKGLVDGTVRQHRYLQAETITALSRFLKEYGQIECQHIDGRNAHAVKMAERMGTAATNYSNE